MKPQDSSTGLPQTTGTQTTNANHRRITPQITQVPGIHKADIMVNNKTIEMILLEAWLVISHGSLVCVVVPIVVHLAVIKLVAEAMVVDITLMVEAVVVEEPPTLAETLPLQEIPMSHVMDVAKIIMSWPVQPHQQNENGLYSIKIDRDNLQLVHHIMQDKAQMVLLTKLTINKCNLPT